MTHLSFLVFCNLAPAEMRCTAFTGIGVFLLKLVFYAFIIKLFYQWEPQKGSLFPHVKMTFGAHSNLKLLDVCRINVCNLDINSILYRGWTPSQFFYSQSFRNTFCEFQIPMRIRRQGSLLNDLRIKSTLLLAVEMTWFLSRDWIHGH